MIKGSNLRMGRFGIEEKPNDELNDILHPNADEEAMERVEKSIDRMREMEKKGVDIYFGGFSVMKSFPFYRVLSNWFAPFSIHHPGIAQAQREIGNSKMIHGLLGRSPMCDSDKYSLVLAWERSSTAFRLICETLCGLPENLATCRKRTRRNWPRRPTYADCIYRISTASSACGRCGRR